MKEVISNLLKLYESSQVTRRELIEGLAMLAVTSETSSAAGLKYKYDSLNHVAIFVSDIQRSVEFYQKVFGLSLDVPPSKTDDPPYSNARLGVGSSQHIAIHRRDPGGVVDHICFGVDNFDTTGVLEDLKQRGATPEVSTVGPLPGLYLKDPDGIKLQIIGNHPSHH